MLDYRNSCDPLYNVKYINCYWWALVFKTLYHIIIILLFKHLEVFFITLYNWLTAALFLSFEFLKFIKIRSTWIWRTFLCISIISCTRIMAHLATGCPILIVRSAVIAFIFPYLISPFSFMTKQYSHWGKNPIFTLISWMI